MKIDLHVHTRHSRKPAIWLLEKMGCPESFTDPLHCYHELKRRGMGGVTFTDHNSIDGCLAVAHLPDTFISEEITARFPGDRCKVHVLAYGITEADHATIQKKRENIYDLVDFLRERNITHAIAHPFSAVNDKFTKRHFEKLLLLFETFEINGDQIRLVNTLLREVLDTLTPEKIDALSQRHGIPAFGDKPWVKRLVSGSDDHAGTRFADSYTEAADAETIGGFFASLENGSATIHTQPATELSFARDIYSVAYEYGKERFGLDRYSGVDVLLRFCNAILQPRTQRVGGLLPRIGYRIGSLLQSRTASAETSLTGFVRMRAKELIRRTPELRAFLDKQADSGDSPEMWFAFVDQIANAATGDLAGTFMQRLRKGQYFDLFHLLGSAGSLYLLLAPYVIAFSFCAAERRLADRMARRFRPEAAGDSPKVACLTDTFHERNNVADELRGQLARALDSGRSMRVITASGKGGARPGVRDFPPAAVWEVPDNDDVRLSFLPVLPLMRHVCEEGYSCLHAATVGPAGLMALLTGRLLGIPVMATYRSGLLDYVRGVTEDQSVSGLAWWYMAWFFNRCDLVQAGSEREMDELARRGVARSKLRLCPCGSEDASAFDAHWSQIEELAKRKRRRNRGKSADARPAEGIVPEFLFGRNGVPADFPWPRVAGLA